MVDNAPPAQANPKVEVNSTIPAVYTYWGQFVDHDLTANTDRDSTTSDITRPDLKPVPPDEVTAKLKNLRRPNARPRQRLRRRAGHHRRGQQGRRLLRRRPLPNRQEQRQPGRAPIAGIKIPPEGDLDRDLPRIGPLLDAGVITEDVLPDALKDDPNKRTRAFIGDLRNDENLVVAQLHLAFLRFHNAVVDRIEANPRDFGLWPGKGRRFQAAVFHCARDVTRHIYQRITVHDYLRTVMFPGVVDKILVGGPKHYRPLRGYRAFMPLEYSVAAFRFGHTMVRGAYDHNRNFGKPAPGQTQRPLIPFAPFDLLFLFTGNGFLRDPDDPTKSIRNPFGGTPTLPFNWIIEWDRFTDKGDPDEGRFARKIDTRLAPPLTTEGMVNEGTAPPIQDEAGKALRVLLRHLARRNLLRGYLLSIPTGQAVAAEMGVAPLSEEELRRGNTPEVNAALDEGGFLRNTPLWYYVLKEAEVRADGNSLGELGSRIVCETIIGLLRHRPELDLQRARLDARRRRAAAQRRPDRDHPRLPARRRRHGLIGTTRRRRAASIPARRVSPAVAEAAAAARSGRGSPCRRAPGRR